MQNINELFSDVQSIRDYICEAKTEQLDEGLMDIIKKLKNKFKQVWNYLRGIVAKISGSYWCTVDDEGNVMAGISVLTSGQAYVDGKINKGTTLVCLGKKGMQITGLNTKPTDARDLYGSGNSIDYWRRMINEGLQNNPNMINEVRMQNADFEAKYNVVDTPALKKIIAMSFKKKMARLLIWGAPGIGKTAILMSVLDELPNASEYSLVVKTLSNETPDNFTLPKYIEIDGQEKATDVPKTWLPVYKPTGDPVKDKKLDDACGKGLLFIDELSRATPQVLNVVLPLINEGIFNGYQLGSGWTIICASNRMEDEMSGQAEIGNALSNRFRQVYYEPTAKSWSKWAQTQGYMSPLLLSWLQMPENENMSGGKFFYMDPNETNENGDVTKLMCTPRSWTNAMKELAEYSETGKLEGFSIFDIDRDIIAFTLNQYVPASAVDSFLAFLHVISKIGNFDDAVNSVWKNGGKGLKIARKDLNLVALPLAQLIVTSHANALPTAKEFTSLAKWLVSINSDQMVSYILDLLQNVFAGMLSTFKNFIFDIKGVYDNNKNEKAKMAVINATVKPFFDKWGVDWQTAPDWSEGFDLIAGAYGEAFEKYKIEDTDALG